MWFEFDTGTSSPMIHCAALPASECEFLVTALSDFAAGIDVPIARAAPLSVSPSEPIEMKPPKGTRTTAIRVAKGETNPWKTLNNETKVQQKKDDTTPEYQTSVTREVAGQSSSTAESTLLSSR